MSASRHIARAASLTLLALLSCSSCVRLNWNRNRWQTPPNKEGSAAVIAAGAPLGEVLSVLGAPVAVREHRRDSVVITYGWDEVDSKGVNLSVPVSRQLSLSLDVRNNRTGARGLLLFFDRDLRLIAAEEGWLQNPRDGVRTRRPSLPETVLSTS